MTLALNDPKCLDMAQGLNWTLYQGDCVEVIKGLPDNSMDFGIHSPPFAETYIYSDSVADMGNCATWDEFFVHYDYLIKELFRTTVPGRLQAIHCKDLPLYRSRDNAAGLRDFPGAIVRAFEHCGWTFHSRVTIWKDPVVERGRTNNHGLLHKNFVERAEVCRQGLPDFLLVFRKWTDELENTESPKPVKHRLDPRNHEFIGANAPVAWRDNRDYSIQVWQRYASPVWFDIKQTNVLNTQIGKDDKDEKHICLADGTLILTVKGYKPIESIEIGDLVLTHLGRWRKVIGKRCTGINAVVQVKAQGVPNLILTPEHKLWTRLAKEYREKQTALQAEPEWVEAERTVGSYVNMKLPQAQTQSSYSEQEWRIVGRWLADGHLHEQRDSIHISCGPQKLGSLKALLGDAAGFTQNTGTSYQIRVKDFDGRLRHIIKQCGRGATNKHLPPEAFFLPAESAKALLEGYLSGDGYYLESRNKWMASSVSRELLLGLALLVQRAYGVVASVYAGRPGGPSTIEGRPVNTHQDWAMCFNAEKDFSAFIAEDGAWKKVRSAESTGEARTWALQVEEDASYTAENCVVKNCPLQLDVISRSVELWTNPGDVVFSPFAGLGSEGYESLKLGRKFVGIELKESYFKAGVFNLKKAEELATQQNLFSLLGGGQQQKKVALEHIEGGE